MSYVPARDKCKQEVSLEEGESLALQYPAVQAVAPLNVRWFVRVVSVEFVSL